MSYIDLYFSHCRQVSRCGIVHGSRFKMKLLNTAIQTDSTRKIKNMDASEFKENFYVLIILIVQE